MNETLNGFIGVERAYLAAQSHAAACHDGLPGTGDEAIWTQDMEDAATRRYLAGERHPKFDTAVVDKARVLAEEQHWEFHEPDSAHPFLCLALDGKGWSAAAPCFQIWMEPDGTFFAGQHRSGVFVEAMFGTDTIDYFCTMVRLGEYERELMRRVAREKRDRGT